MSSILIDASAAFDQNAGIGRYSRNILSHLIPVLPEAEWTLFQAPSETGGETDALWTAPEGVRHVRYPLSRRRFDQLGVRLGLPLPIRPLTGPQSLVYSPDFTAPPFHGVPRIVTVHDIAFLTHPHLTTPGMVSFLASALERELSRGALIATVSETTRSRLMDGLGVSGDRVRVIPNGVDARFFNAEPLAHQVRAELGVPDEYLLMVGTIEPRKNHEGVLRAIANRSDRGLPLVVVGREGWGTRHVLPMLRNLQERGQVIWLNRVQDTYLPGLYAASRGVVYPSWTEGFGLPVIEALAAGRPVVTGTDPVFAEVGGSLVTSVEPADEPSLLDGIRMLEESVGSHEIAAARRLHAAHYNWERSADVLALWIRRIMEEDR